MKKLLNILLVDSLTDLFKHKSFFLLIFVLVLVDRGIKLLQNTFHIEIGVEALEKIDMNTAAYLFDELPPRILTLLTDYRTFLVLGGLFILKQIISLWPSSDMRRMHRRERGHFGILASLGAIRWQQLLWDAIAVSTLCLITGVWVLFWFGLNRWGWHNHPSMIWLGTLAVTTAAVSPVILSGFSYSSKLAVISNGTFAQKLSLFYRLFYDWRVAVGSWLFYCARLVIEVIFVAAIPAYILTTVDNFFIRVPLAAILATPVYSYLKMASFKFFLVIYEPFSLVQEEYQDYYNQLSAR